MVRKGYQFVIETYDIKIVLIYIFSLGGRKCQPDCSLLPFLVEKSQVR